jgi:hypothetical protein
MAFLGSQAALVFYARPAVAIEAQTGLTDRWIARRPLARRGRVGHEKVAPVSYVIDERKVHFTVHRFPAVVLGFDEVIPIVAAALDGIPVRIVRWEPEVLEELKGRGAVVQDFPRELDQYLAALDRKPDATVRADYAKFRRFYFKWVTDPVREAPFLARVGAGEGAR